MFTLDPLKAEEGSFTGNYTVYGGKQGAKESRNTTSIFDGEDGTVWTSLAPCTQGRGSVFCNICPEGTYKQETGISDCLPCMNAPSHSIYTAKGYYDENCPYQCLSGYKGLDCLTPFHELLRQLGGPLVLVLILSISSITVLLTIFLVLHYNSMLINSISS